MAIGPVRWGLLGTARINERLVPPIRESRRSELVAVASRSRAKAERYAEEWRVPRAHGSYEGMLADPQVDAVYVSLPNSLHAEWTVKCAEAGKHVLCEKPLALTPDDVDRMAEAAARNDVVVQEACMMLYHAQTRKVRDLVAQGAIGDVRALRGVFSFTLSDGGDIRLEPSLGGGALWDLGSYPVSFMRAVMRENPVEVQGTQIGDEGGVDLTFAGQLRFASGAVGQLYCSFQALPHSEGDIVGSRGMVHLDLPWVNRMGVTANVSVVRTAGAQGDATFSDVAEGSEAETLVFENVNGYQDEVDAMEAGILDGAEPAVPLAHSRDTVATVVALHRSAREGRPVRL